MNSDISINFIDKLKKNKIIVICVAIIVVLLIALVAVATPSDRKNKAENTVSTITTTVPPVTTVENTTNKASGTVSGTTVEPIEQTTAANKTSGTVSVITGGNVQTTQAGVQEIKIGQTVSNESFDFTLNSVQLSYMVKPKNPPSYYTYYTAADGEVYIYVNATVKNKMKKAAESDEIYTVVADYNDGYTYEGFNIVDDSDGDFTYANITNVDPLQSLGVHTLIGCPEEVDTSDAPLFLTITIRGGGEYTYVIR